MIKQIFSVVLAILLVVNIASALVVTSVFAPKFAPGEEKRIEINFENTFSTNIEDITFTLDFKDLPFIPVGGSSAGFDELDPDDDAHAGFTIRAANDIAPGDYQIPYTITYLQDNEERTRAGSIGISVSSQPALSYTINTENPVIGAEGKINLKIINSGFADAKFVSVKARGDGFTILSENEIYIGSIDSDDFETANFDVVFNSAKPRFTAIVEYTDFDNKKVTEAIEIPVTVYSKEKAIQLGIIEESRLGLYIGIVVAVIVIWLVWRAIRKRQRLKKSERS